MHRVKLNATTAQELLADLVDATGPDTDHTGTLVQTDYGVVHVPDNGMAGIAIAVDRDGHQWNYVWVLAGEDGAPDLDDLLRAVARATVRQRVEGIPTWNHQLRSI